MLPTKFSLNGKRSPVGLGKMRPSSGVKVAGMRPLPRRRPAVTRDAADRVGRGAKRPEVGRCGGVGMRRRTAVPPAGAVAKEVGVGDSALLDAGDDIPSLGKLISFVLPACGIWVIAPVLSLVDTAVVGTKSMIHLGALGPATMLCDYISYIFTFVTLVVTNRVSIALSRRDVDGAGHIVSDALAISLAMGVALGAALTVVSPAVLSKIAGKASAALVAPATDYVRIRSLGLPGFLVTEACQGFFIAAGDPVTPLVALLIAAVGNLIGDLFLVNICGWGIHGAAVATAVAQITAAVVLVYRLHKPLGPGTPFRNQKVSVEWGLPSITDIIKFCRTGGPVFGMLAVKVLMYSLLTSVATGLSPISSGAHHVAFCTFLFFSFAGDAICMAAQSFLPGIVGQPAKAWRLTLSLQKASGIAGTVVALSAAGLLLQFPYLFTSSPAVAGQMIGLVPFVAAVVFAHGLSMMTEGVLLAGQEAAFLLAGYSGNIAVAMLSLYLLRSLGFGLPAIWWTIAQFQSVRWVINWIKMLQPNSVLNRTQPLEE